MSLTENRELTYKPSEQKLQIIRSFEVPSSSLPLGIHEVKRMDGDTRYVLEMARPDGSSSLLPLYKHEAALLFPEQIQDYLESPLELTKGLIKKGTEMENELEIDMDDFAEEEEKVVDDEAENTVVIENRRKINYEKRKPQKVLEGIEESINMMLDSYEVDKSHLVQIDHSQYPAEERNAPVRGKMQRPTLSARKLSNYSSDEVPDEAMNEILSTSLLTQWEEIELFRHYHIMGDIGARDKIILKNLRLVSQIASKYARVYKNDLMLSKTDLENDGTIGLMHAVDKFDPTKGFKLSTYVTWWLRQSITRKAHNDGRLVRLPVHISANMVEAAKKLSDYESKEGRSITNAEKINFIMRQLNLTEKAAKNLLQHLITDKPVSFDVNIGRDDDTNTLGDRLVSNDPGPAEVALISMAQQDVEKLLDVILERKIDSLKENSRKDKHLTNYAKYIKIFKLRWGLPVQMDPQVDAVYTARRDSKKDFPTLEQIGIVYKLSRERVRQIEEMVMGDLEIVAKEIFGENSEEEIV